VELENLEHVEWGVTLALHALWEELGLTRKLRQCFRGRKPLCPTEVLVRTMVTNRLSDPTSKLGIVRWLVTVVGLAAFGPADRSMGRCSAA
jgi:hypothetical protein